MTGAHGQAATLAGLQLELAMALGSTLELAPMLEEVLELLLRRLDGRSAVVYGEGPPHRPLCALPRSAPKTLGPPEPAAEPAAGAGWRETARPDGSWRYDFPLPGLGWLALERHLAPLDPLALRALMPLTLRLGRQGRACLDHAALRASEARFAALVATLPEVVFEGTLRPGPLVRLDYVSPRAMEVLGIEAEVLRAAPERLAARMPAEDRAALQACLARAAQAPAPFEQVIRLEAGGGAPRWILVAGNPKGPAEAPRWSGFIQDVTARERLAGAERESARLRMSALLGAVGDAIVGSDASGRITHWNEAATRLLGFEADAAIGQPLELIIPARLRAAHARGMARHQATGESRVIGRPIELPALHAAGHELDVELVLERVEAHGEAFFLGVLRDLTGRRLAAQAQARAAESERRFATALYDIGRVALEDARAFARIVTAKVAQALDVAWVSLWARRGDALVCVDRCEARHGRHSGGQRLEAKDCPAYLQALEEDAPLVAPDARAHPALQPLQGPLLEPLGVVSALHVPLRSLEGPAGVLAIDATTPQTWGTAAQRFCVEVAGLVAQVTARAHRRKLEARHEVVLAAIGDGVIACDGAGRVTLLNPVAARLTGWTRDAALGRPLAEVFTLRSSAGSGPDAEAVGSLAEAALATGEDQRRRHAVALLARGGGATLIADRASVILEDGQQVGAVITFRDVAHEEGARQALQQQRERLETVLASTSAILYAARLPDFAVEYVSESAAEVLGFPVAAHSTPGFWVDCLHPEDRDRVLTGLEGVAVRGRHTHEYRHRHADGSYRWLRDEVRVVYGPSGEAVRAIGASFDITERKRGEHRLAALLAVQQIISRASAAFLASRPGLDPGAIDVALAELGALARAERAYVFLIEGAHASNTHEWCAPGIAPQRAQLQGLPAEEFSFFLDPLERGEPLCIEAVSKLPQAAQAEREILSAQGIERLIAVPLIRDGVVRGFIGIDNPIPAPLEQAEFASLMRLLADTVSAGLQRVLDERALRGLNADLRRKTEQQRALLELSTQLARARSRAELFETLSSSLSALLEADRVSLIEQVEPDRFRIRLLDERPGAPAGDSAYVSAGQLEREVSRVGLAGHAPLRVMETGLPLSTADLPLTDLPDWRYLHARFGYQQFVVVPLVDLDGVRGTLNVCHARPQAPSPAEIDWIAQCGAVLVAHLYIHDVREALERLNIGLESRVEARTRELRASEERFERLFWQAPQAMLILDLAGRVVQSNRNAQRLFAAPPAGLTGASLAALMPGDAAGEPAALIEASAPQEPPGTPIPERVITAAGLDGRRFQASVGVVPIDLDGHRHLLTGVSDITDRLAAEAAVTRSLREKETLLKEIHHRVKNNLQIISSLLMLQAEHLPEGAARALIEESVLRVRSMALIHQQLYGVESLARLDFGDYARSLAGSLCAILAPGARLRVDAQESWITVETAVPLGLILNELLTNAFKYGALSSEGRTQPGRTGPDCDVLVEVGPIPAGLRVAVIDSGPGLPEGFEPARSPGLGMQLVRSLGRQLRGQLAFDVDRGSRFVVTCPTP